MAEIPLSVGDKVKIDSQDHPYKGKVVGIDRVDGNVFYNIEFQDSEGITKRMFFNVGDLVFLKG